MKNRILISALFLLSCFCVVILSNTVTLSNLNFYADPNNSHILHDVVIVISNPNSGNIQYNVTISGTTNGQPWSQSANGNFLLKKNSEFHSFTEASLSDTHQAWGGFSGLGYSRFVRSTIPWPFQGTVTVTSTSSIKAYAYTNGTLEYATSITTDPRDKTDCTSVYDDYTQYLSQYTTAYRGKSCIVLPWLDLWSTYDILPGWNCYVNFKNFDISNDYDVYAIIKDSWQCNHNESDWVYVVTVPHAEQGLLPSGKWKTIPGTASASLRVTIFVPELMFTGGSSGVWSYNPGTYDAFSGVVFLSRADGAAPTVESHYMISETWYQ